MYLSKLYISLILFISLSLISVSSEEITEVSKTSNNTDKSIFETKREKHLEELRDRIKHLKLQKELLNVQNSIEKAKFQSSIRKLETNNKKLSLENEQLLLQLKKDKIKQSQVQDKLNAKLQEIKYETRLLEFEKLKKQSDIIDLDIGLRRRSKTEDWNSEINIEVNYTISPLQDNIVTISDRKIVINEVITYSLADHITEKVDFFNNKSTKYPIFIVIERCPGGSVVAGYKIIKSIEHSRAPVYVIVKSYAASMAAIIVGRVEHAYAYPQAIILHHQVSSWNIGNLRQQQEQLDISKEWMKRLYTPLAEKMNLTLDQFIEKMYENNSNGDWQEFATDAVSFKWLRGIVDEIRDQSVRKLDADTNTFRFPLFFAHKEEMDSEGGRYVRLPVLNRYDVYFLDNRDKYYRY